MKRFKKRLSLIAFDADDTLWDNEPKYKKAEKEFCEILSSYVDINIIPEELLKTEMKNLPVCGYGTKSFCMSMIETAARVTQCRITSTELYKIYELGKGLLKHPVIPYDGVVETLERVSAQYPIALITKGDTLEQERKLFSSGIMDKFDFIEIVNEKDEKSYCRLLDKFKVAPEEFLMIGNSPKSDILPVLKIGASAVYIPSTELWAHETADENEFENYPESYMKLKSIKELCGILCK